MVDFKISEKEFLINGKATLFLCGEIQYFRMQKKSWEPALDALVESGCNAVAYYVPWFVHEYEENKFDFTGEIHPNNDLRSWIALTQKKGLLGFLRPGPYVYAETTDLGVPKWFTEHYPDARVKEYRDGVYSHVGDVNFASHNHPDFIKAVEVWYAAVAEEVKAELAPKGNIVMFQLCNEIPGEDIDDRNPVTLGIGEEKGLLPTYLRQKYKTLDSLNASYHSAFLDFVSVEPHHLEEAEPLLAKEEHLEFYYGYYYPYYFKTLKEIAMKNGITITMSHNAYNPRALSLHYHNHLENPWLALSVDCYYSLMGQLHMESATYFCEYGAEYMKHFLKCVPWIAEQESGYWFDTPVLYGAELYINNIWSVAAGYKGMNMYLFAGGENRSGMGFYGSHHNWQAPVGSDGNKLENFSDIKRSLSDIKRDKAILESELRYDITLGIKNDAGLIWKETARYSDEAFYLLKTAGFTPEICDFQASSIEELGGHKYLWIVSDERMSRLVQEKMIEYIRRGGHLIISGQIPDKDEKNKECKILAEHLGVQVYSSVMKEEDQQKIIHKEEEYDIGRTVQLVETEENYIFATERNGKPCMLKIPFEKGVAEILLFHPKVRFYSVIEVIKEFLKEIGLVPSIENAGKLRVLPKENGKSILLNLHPISVKEKIRIAGIEYEAELQAYSYYILAEAEYMRLDSYPKC